MRHSPKKLVGLIAAAAVGVAVGIAAPASGAVDEQPVVEWGGTTHTTRESLELWLADRGLDYDAWAYQHPLAALQLDRAAERAESVTTTPPRRSAPPATDGRALSTPLLVLVVALGLGLGTLALLLSSANIRFNPSLRFASDRRAYIAFAGAACVTVAAASYAVQF